MDEVSAEYVSYVIQDRPVAETSKLYSDWRGNYDKAMEVVNYNGPLVTATAFNELGLDRTVRILDVGAGTGKLGKELKDRGYLNLDALDPSDMVLKAIEDGIYQNYISDYVQLGRPLTIPKATYDVAIMVGVFTPGHMHVEDLLEIAQVVKPGGLICWVSSKPGYYEKEVPKYSAENVQSIIDKYVKDGIWEVYRPPKVVENYYKNDIGVFYSMKVMNK